MTAEHLPPLPEPHWPRGYHGSVPGGGYTADQMHAYARSALAAQVAQAESLRVRLGQVAAIAHQGGLAGHDSITALACVRQLTLPYWDKTETEAELLKRVLAATSAAMKGQA